MIHLKAKGKNLGMIMMMMKRKTNGGVHFAAKRESSNQSFQATNIPTQTFVDKDNNEDDDKNDNKVEFFVKVGKHKENKFFQLFSRKKLILI